MQTLFASYHLDSAKNNQIIDNRFEQVEKGVIVEDDGTIIEGNRFAATIGMPIVVGSEIREESAAGAIKNTRIKNNTFINKSIEQAIDIRTASKTATHIE